VDQGRKNELYGSGGASWYWLVDLARPEVIVFENVGGALVEVQRIGSGGDTTVGPFPVAVDPADLARP
jgi:hypothetical protein